MNKIRTLSRIMRIFFQCLIIGLPLINIILWFYGPTYFNTSLIRFIPSGAHLTHPLSAETKALGFVIDLIPLGVNISILYFLARLFRYFEAGKLFVLQNARTIKHIAYALLMGQVLSPIHEGLITTAMSWSSGPGHRSFSMSFGSNNITVIGMAIIILVMAWVFVEAYKLREESELTI